MSLDDFVIHRIQSHKLANSDGSERGKLVYGTKIRKTCTAFRSQYRAVADDEPVM